MFGPADIAFATPSGAEQCRGTTAAAAEAVMIMPCDQAECRPVNGRIIGRKQAECAEHRRRAHDRGAVMRDNAGEMRLFIAQAEQDQLGIVANIAHRKPDQRAVRRHLRIEPVEAEQPPAPVADQCFISRQVATDMVNTVERRAGKVRHRLAYTALPKSVVKGIDWSGIYCAKPHARTPRVGSIHATVAAAPPQP